MFSNLLFLLFNLLLFANATDQTAWPLLPHAPVLALLVSLAAYAIVLLVIYLQNGILRASGLSRETILFINNFELLAFFAGYYFIAGAHRPFLTAFAPFGQSVALLFSLILYFGALVVCHAAMQSRQHKEGSASAPVRLLVPFSLPFLFFVLLSDAQSLLPDNLFSNLSPAMQITVAAALNLLALVLAVIFLPPLAVLLWKCPNMPESPLKDELEALCKRANFSHAGLKLWSVMKTTCTAAIIGVMAPFRYILFTQKLLDTLPPRCVKAVLAHEIGHSRRHHLLLYPLVLLGMAAVGTLALLPFYNGVVDKDWQATNQLIMFVIFAIVVALYFRFVFGYFSRTFERDADLFVFDLDVPAKDMVDALDMLAITSGNIHMVPNWHHHSIQDRIDFLERADKDRRLIEKHRRKIKHSLIAYTLLVLVPALACLYAFFPR